MRYLPVQPEELSRIAFTLELMDKLMIDEIEFHLYGLTSDPLLLKAASICLAASAEDEDGGSALSGKDIAISIPLTADTLRSLQGEGFEVTDTTEFSYLSNGEGARSDRFWALQNYPNRYRMPHVRLQALSTLALASSDLYCDDFMQQFGSAPGITRDGSGDPSQPQVLRPKPSTPAARERQSPTLQGN